MNSRRLCPPKTLTACAVALALAAPVMAGTRFGSTSSSSSSGGAGSDTTAVHKPGGAPEAMSGTFVAPAGIFVSTLQINGATNSTGPITTSSSMTVADLLVNYGTKGGTATYSGSLTASSITSLGNLSAVSSITAAGLTVTGDGITSSSLTVVGANGVRVTNGLIAATGNFTGQVTASSGTFQDLKATGEVSFASGTTLGATTTARGTVEISSTNLQITGNASTPFQIGSSSLVVLSSNVGIGLANPLFPLDVQSYGTTDGVRFVGNGAGGRQLYLGTYNGTSINYTGSQVGWSNFGAWDASPIAVWYRGSAGSEVARIGGNGLSINNSSNAEQFLDLNGAAIMRATMTVVGAANFQAAVTVSSLTAVATGGSYSVTGSSGIQTTAGSIKITGSGSPATGSALCINASGILSICTSLVAAGGTCSCQ